MKHADLIRAALDGKVIQRKFREANWSDFPSLGLTIRELTREYPAVEYRIKPEPPPDQVFYDVIRLTQAAKSPGYGPYTTLQALHENWKPSLQNVQVRLTINGETGAKTVEIVE
jgi:hypothetical protein